MLFHFRHPGERADRGKSGSERTDSMVSMGKGDGIIVNVDSREIEDHRKDFA